MTTFEKGQRVRVTEEYAKNISAPKPEELEETGALGTVTDWKDPYVSVKLDTTGELEGYYLFLEDELEPA